MDTDIEFCDVCGTNHVVQASCPPWAQAVVVAPFPPVVP